ncbi:MAG: glycosyltransferase [Odoribacter sp.]|nr:glycosyltransferase [Odoribacter sp.]
MAKVSVIVPVYNAGEYLRKCVDSLIHQTLTDIEIIFVLDCPTDGSDAIIKEYASQDDRIKVIANETNLRTGLSRNRGLDAATGEYIAFSDHDDYCNVDMLEKMYLKAKETDADVVVSDFFSQNEREWVLNSFPVDGTDEEFQQASFKYLVGWCNWKDKKKSVKSNGLIWNQLYKRSFLEANHIHFQDNLKITAEDRLFLIEVYLCARKIVRLPEAFYYHVYVSTSEGRSYHYLAIDRIINYLGYLYSFLNQHHCLEEMSNYFVDSVLRSLYTGFRKELKYRSLGYTWKKILELRSNQLVQMSLPKIKGLRKYPCTKIAFYYLLTLFTKSPCLKANA